MKCRSVQKLSFLAGLGIGAVAATPDGVLQLDIQRRSPADGAPPVLVRRASDTVVESLQNNIKYGAYMADAKIGSPPQTLALQLDTGSSDTWVVYTGASVCQAGNCTGGSFDFNRSSTFDNRLKGAFNILYGDKTSAKGDYFNDVFTIGGATLQNLSMGIGLTTDIPFGLIGIGYSANEAGVLQGIFEQPYPNLPKQLVQEGFTSTVAYSMWLNDLAASAGNILFGGIDTAKFTSPLIRLKFYPTRSNSTINDFAVKLTSVTAHSKSGSDKLGSSSFPASVVLDSGTTQSILPPDLVAQIHKEVNAYVDPASGIAGVPCTYARGSGSFAFGFGGPGGATITVTMSELVLPTVVTTFTDGPNKGQEACVFAIRAPRSSSERLILGDSFLRSAYVVFDLINNEAALAQTKFNVTDSNVVAFASLGATVPSSTPAPSQANVADGVLTASPTSYAAAAAFTASSAASSAAGQMVARGGDVISVGMAVLVAMVAGGTSWAVLYTV